MAEFITSAKAIKRNEPIVAALVETLKSAQAGVLVDYRGLTVEQDTNLRRKLREAGVEYKVVKNTLTTRAAQEVGLAGLEEQLHGPTALAISTEDPVAPAKVIADFAKEAECLQIKAGFLDGNVISLEEVKTLANTPSKAYKTGNNNQNCNEQNQQHKYSNNQPAISSEEIHNSSPNHIIIDSIS